jgi:hypothetical protein
MKENKCRSTIDDQARHKDKQNQERDRSASNREQVVADKSNGKYKNANKIK